ncbi:fused response regulator/phosphatase [Saccharophagus degradans]|uniref:Response regulator receiver n=1 Tax=Saccharophagus degradans (strain 2-40 / ATCC 43961 / DSM 17024) TaxID=203122 RepID=Q21G04_SACD2|nr:fused response regulator/phosphatase [Saccharophagus degradans]ABD82375.1 response regulator receiver [Saccharophagus degradans 2-40]
MKILVVDDHAYNRDLLQFILEDEGHSCCEADSGEAAVKMFLENEDIDLILMDVNMPLMNGIEATEKISEIKGPRAVTIIFVTALDDSDILIQCLNAGGDDFVPKPVNESILISKINAHARNIENYKQLLDAHNTLDMHNKNIRREHEIVENVFRNSLTRSNIECDNVVSYSSPMSMFNGDLTLTAPSPSGGQYFLLGDFTGHGLSAAIGSLPVMNVFFDNAAKQVSVSALAVEINNQLYRILPMGMFFCAAIGHLDKTGTQLTVWSGGMNDALLLSSDNKSITAIPGAHMPLGILRPEEFDDRAQLHELEKNAKIFFYTDGVDEAQNKDGELFGDDRVRETILASNDNYITNIISAVKEFTGDEHQDDDISIIKIVCAPCVHRSKNTGNIVDVAADFHSIDSFPWQLLISLESIDLQRSDIVNQVVSFLGTIQGVELHQDKLFTIVSELFNNSLEHGVLNLDSSIKNTAEGFEEYYRMREERLREISDKQIHIALRYVLGTPNRVEFEITDSGEGFDYETVLMRGEDTNALHGRGIGLLQTLCSKLEYSEGGRKVTAHYDFIE